MSRLNASCLPTDKHIDFQAGPPKKGNYTNTYKKVLLYPGNITGS